MARELDNIQWYDEEVWTLIFETAATKKKINNLYDFRMIHGMMYKLNNAAKGEPGFHLNGKFDGPIGKLLEKHYTPDRQWKYNADTREMRPL